MPTSLLQGWAVGTRVIIYDSAFESLAGCAFCVGLLETR